MEEDATTIYTFGHSTRSMDEILHVLGLHSIGCIVDVRAFPASRRHPHVARENLSRELPRSGIDYEHAPELGGRRSGKDAPPGSAGTGGAWRNPSFRAYAQYAQSDAFHDALDRLEAAAAGGVRIALMCSEAVPWRCHRWLVSDSLVVRGVRVLHVIGPGTARRHSLSPFAQALPGGRVAWPAPEGEGGEVPPPAERRSRRQRTVS